MSLSKIIISVIFIIALAALGWVYFSNVGSPSPAPAPAPVVTTPVVPIVQNTATPMTEMSDDALASDLNDVDAQLKSLSDDASKADTAINDKPVQQLI